MVVPWDPCLQRGEAQTSGHKQLVQTALAWELPSVLARSCALSPICH